MPIRNFYLPTRQKFWDPRQTKRLWGFTCAFIPYVVLGPDEVSASPMLPSAPSEGRGFPLEGRCPSTPGPLSLSWAGRAQWVCPGLVASTLKAPQLPFQP